MTIAENYKYIERHYRSQISELRVDGDVQERLVALVNYLSLQAYEISGDELVQSANYAKVPLDNDYVRTYIAKANQVGILLLRDDEITQDFTQEDVDIDQSWTNYAMGVRQIRDQLFTPTNDKSGNINNDMKIARAECPSCGMFEINTDDGGEIIYVRYSRHPRYRVECPECGERVVSKINRDTAHLFEDLGVKARHHATEITDDEIDDFMDNFQSELELLLA